MGCGGSTRAASERLVRISTIKKKSKTPRPAAGIERKRSVFVEDFHCEKCGLTLRNRPPNYAHRCPGKRSLGYQVERQAKCDVCSENVDGVCQEYNRLHPNRPCVIETGVSIASAACPLGKWPKTIFSCPSCKRQNFDTKDFRECFYCGFRVQPLNMLAEECLAYPPGFSVRDVLPLPLAVTALSRLPHHRERQGTCLDSWKEFGLQIVAVNTPEEIAELRPFYPQVDKWQESFDVSTRYESVTQRITSLTRQAIIMQQPVLVINSDIEIYGDPQQLQNIIGGGAKAVVGIRHNYKASWCESTRERWGLDAFYITPRIAATIPDIGFAIGKPMWDYWLPIHFASRKIRSVYVGYPLFFHKSHPVHWSMPEWKIGEREVHSVYGFVDTNTMRLSLPYPPPITADQLRKSRR